MNRITTTLLATLEGVSASVGRNRQPAGMRSALRLLARIGIEPMTIADVGASDGRWSQVAHKVFPEAQLVLFEPQPAHARALERFQLDYPTARIVRRAVGGAGGVSAFDASDPWSGVLEARESETSIDVEVVTLDEALGDAAPPILVKLDTHGVESAILSGAERTLDRSVAWVIEAYNQRIAAGALLFWELCAFMADRGFRPIDLVDVMHRPRDDTLWQMDLFFVRSDWAGFGYVEYA